MRKSLRTPRRAIVGAGAVFAIVIAVSGAPRTVSPAAASTADGGDSIATAKALPVGVRITNTSRRPEYWRVELGLADQFVVDIGSTDRRSYAEVCVLAPDVNDYSSEEAPCRAMVSTNVKRQLRFVAPSPGAWIVVVYGCVGCTIFRPAGAGYTAYEFTAHVRRFTSVTLPSIMARVARPATLRGSVRGAGGGPVEIVRLSQRRWVPLGTTQLRPDGSFLFKTTFHRRGAFKVGAVYAGDDGHRPSRDTATLTVR